MPRRIARVLLAVGLQLVALVLAHDLVFLARYGSLYGEALVHAGHGETWSAAVATSLGLGIILAAAAAVRLAWLGMLVRRRTAARGTAGRVRTASPPSAGSLVRAWLRIGPRVSLLAVVLLTVQENMEHGALGGGSFNPGLLLTREYAGGLWITMAVGFVVGLIAALFEWRHGVLLARLRALRPAIPRRPAAVGRATLEVERPAGSLLGRRSALRAPPFGARC